MILPVLGGVCNEENVALGALIMTSNPYFKDHAEFQGFLLHNGARPACTLLPRGFALCTDAEVG